jgi:hypothetical protein
MNDTINTWRDLTAELTAKQIASLEHAETMMPASHALLGFSRVRRFAN